VHVGPDDFVGISDRGPNGEVGGRRTFPLRQFCPFISRFHLRAGQIEIAETLLLTDSHSQPLNGRSNRPGEEPLFETPDAAPLPFDPSGVDPEAIRVFPDGRFLIAEEYGPSVLVVSARGEVLVRYTPRPLPGARYPVRAILPEVLAGRRANRGFEALALSPDGGTAWVLLQSPLGTAAAPKWRAARVVRALRLDVTDPLNARVTGHFLLPLSPAAEYAANLKQTAVKVNDAEWLATDRLLLLEQAGATARLLVAEFSRAGNLQGQPGAATLAPEAVGDALAALEVTPATVELWAVLFPPADGPLKLEGLAVLSPTEIALSHDNDFGQGDGPALPSQVWKCRLPRSLPLAR
jgi:alkaline phosphatase